jgi:hypothetical protein
MKRHQGLEAAPRRVFVVWKVLGFELPAMFVPLKGKKGSQPSGSVDVMMLSRS